MSPRIISACAMLAVISCAAHVRGQQRVTRIINGTPTTEFPQVGTVGTLSAGGFCTGTLIGPQHVLTAAHCAEAMLALDDEQSGVFEVDGQVYLTSRIFIHPDYDPRTFANDIAVLELAEPVTDVEPLDYSLVSPIEGESVIIVGFGGQGTPEEGDDGSFGEKLVGTTTIDVVLETEIVWAFDNVSESNPAPGDSGGPVMVDQDGRLVVVGVVSAGTTVDAALGDTTFSTRVDAFADWIDFAIAEAGASPADDDPSPPDETDEPDKTEDTNAECPSVAGPESPPADTNESENQNSPTEDGESPAVDETGGAAPGFGDDSGESDDADGGEAVGNGDGGDAGEIPSDPETSEDQTADTQQEDSEAAANETEDGTDEVACVPVPEECRRGFRRGRRSAEFRRYGRTRRVAAAAGGTRRPTNSRRARWR